MRYAATLALAFFFAVLPAYGQARDYQEYEDTPCPPSGKSDSEPEDYETKRACPPSYVYTDNRIKPNYEQLRNREHTYEEGYTDGANAVEDKSGRGWLLGSLGAGLIGGPIGAGLVYGSAREAEDTAGPRRTVIEDRYSIDYWTGYEHAYNARYDDLREERALIGGLTGTAILGGVLTFLAVR